MPFESRSDNDPATSWAAFFHDDRFSAPFSILCLLPGSQPPHFITEIFFFYNLTEYMYVYIRKSCQSIGCVTEACRSPISAYNGYGKSKDPFPRQELRECRRNWKDLLPSDHVCMSIHKRLSPVQLESWGKVSGTVTRGWMWLSAH